MNNFKHYKSGKQPLPANNRLWPLFGKGLENLGRDDGPIFIDMPELGPDELLVRHDACGLCFSDIKVIRLGEEHPRIYRDMENDPVVLGHEVSMTVVGVGKNLQDQYQVGDRFIVEADIFINGISYAYGYEIQGGLSQYNVIDQRILNGDGGNYLIPIQPDTGYAESALIEPWACVIAAYDLHYRNHLKSDGTAWFVGPDNGTYQLSSGMDENAHPAKIRLMEMNGSFGDWLRKKAEELDIAVEEMAVPEPFSGEDSSDQQVDDIILLAPTTDLIEQMSPYLAPHGILAFSTDHDLDRKVSLDVGRIHYNRWLFLGGEVEDLAEIYQRAPQRSQLKKGGRTMVVGAGGPMGRMHVQHAIESKDHPNLIVCSDASDERLQELDETFSAEARENGIEWVCVNPVNVNEYQKAMQPFEVDGFDDILMLVPIPEVIAEGYRWLGDDGLMNVFAGVARGTMAEIDLNTLVHGNKHIIGHSGSQIEDMQTMLQKVESDKLQTNRSVAAIGSLSAAKDGMKAMMKGAYPGKVVIFPNIQELPLTALPDLKQVLPTVAAKLKDGRIWTKGAERELFEELGIGNEES